MSDKLELTDEQLKEIEENMDPETLAAIDKALDEVEKEKAKASTTTPSQILADHIRSINKTEKLACLSKIKLQPPAGLTRENVAELVKNLEHDTALAGIATIAGKNDIYLYDTKLWTERFAAVQALLEDKDIIATIAAAARHDCKVYPRPLRTVALMDSPYFYTKDEILGAIARMKLEDGYEDIDTVKASNGNICIYSSEFMSKKYAQSLCEFIEVERNLCQ
ncbi:hypothetical protein [Hydrogenoanaerobacterium sp.]|uniref:hypothetical protein n=1 Tax=Hydrogenoanaerobacterium sp. TaxID=2953763 RepID=UPI0028A29A68|nr:hypothetical protein [Hydrogenoanaerobacterium sp.]